MDLQKYADARSADGIRLARTERSRVAGELAARGALLSGFGQTVPLNAALEAFRLCTADALAGLEARRMNEHELAEWERVWEGEIKRQHYDLADEMNAGHDVRERTQVAANICLQNLAVFVATGRDQLRLSREVRKSQWRIALVSAAGGAVLGVGATLLIKSLTR